MSANTSRLPSGGGCGCEPASTERSRSLAGIFADQAGREPHAPRPAPGHDCAPRDVSGTCSWWEEQPRWMLDAKEVHVTSEHREGVGVELRCPTNLLGFTVQDTMRVTGWEPPRTWRWSTPDGSSRARERSSCPNATVAPGSAGGRRSTRRSERSASSVHRVRRADRPAHLPAIAAQPRDSRRREARTPER
jgi:hypothetical protein